MSRRYLLVGQAPSRTGDPLRPLLEGRSGSRLRLLMGLSLRDYIRAFERANLLPVWPGRSGRGDAFPMVAAREAAGKLLQRVGAAPGTLLVGKNVARAFSADGLDPCAWGLLNDVGDGDLLLRVAWVPHPSGINRRWNNPDNLKRGRAFLETVGVDAVLLAEVRG